MRLTLVLSACLAATLAVPAAGEAVSPFPDFTFKRQKAPPAGTRPRIGVQIDPEEQARILAARPKTVLRRPDAILPQRAQPEAAPPAGAQDYAWFWDGVPLNGSGPGGLEGAMNALAAPPGGVSAPEFRLDDLRRIADRHGIEILKATVGTRVSPALALAVIAVESAGRTDAVSHAGATGLMQLMPDTAARFGVTDSTNAVQNIEGGVKYLDWLMGRFQGDPLLVLAGYNAGEGAVDKHSGVPPYVETLDYVPKVLAAFRIARGLCLTPPMLASDGCVFVNGRTAQNG